MQQDLLLANLQVYLVGGAVRDQLLGQPVKERDWVVVGSSPKELLQRGFKPVGKDFPVFLHPHTHEEYALARTERKTAPGYKGFIFHADPQVTLVQDLARRDLTINAIAQDNQGQLIDPYTGQHDIQHKILRHVSPAFIEDPVRVLRIARFAARFTDFTIAPETQKLMQTMQHEMQALVPERVWQEFHLALATVQPLRFLMTLQSCGALVALFPELAPHLTQLKFLDQANPLLRWAYLCLPLISTEILALCQRYRVPEEYRRLTLYAQQVQTILQQPILTAMDLLALLNSLDVWRQPKYLTNLCIMFADNSQVALINCAYQATQKLNTRQWVTEGLTGKAYGEAVKQARLACIEQSLTKNLTN